MTARQFRTVEVTVMNIVQWSDINPETMMDAIDAVIDAEEFDVPDEMVTVENVERINSLLAYYTNTAGWLVGLWGRMKVAAGRTDHQRIAVRDYLDKAYSVCGKKYDAASRQLTLYQEKMKIMGPKVG